MSADYLLQLCGSLAGGLKYTVSLFFITVLVSIPIGLLLSFTRVGRSKVLKGVVGAYVWVMRGTPLLLQLYFFCYGITFLPGIGDYLVMDRFQAAILAFILNYAAYFCEIFRGGILSVDKGQYEAAKVLGYSKWQTTTKIVIPQMLKVCLPPVSNECITLVKDTALVTAIGVTEILYFAKASVNRDVNATAYLVAAAFYLLMTYGLTKLFQYLEKKYSY
ncbi:MAG: amino acid ABC transporter permease [Clostridiales bacterium]|jgi:amino ABC transporter, permease protein, 3-TM region, his/glu/gln/arg/opine family|nr:amino acid ABC transporter permease [Clostridiales bacterium]